ncbi:Cullin [Blastocladiella britannica]|nr:Cullin [Blastocladiella britannica]
MSSAQKLKIRPARAPGSAGPGGSSASATAHADAMAVVTSATRVIYTQSASTLSFEQIYRNAYQLTLARRGDQLCSALIATLSELLKATVDDRLAPLITDLSFPVPSTTSTDADAAPSSTASAWTVASPESLAALGGDQGRLFLATVLGVWDHFVTTMKLVSDVLMYLDKNYLIERRLPTSWEMGLLVFRDHGLRSTSTNVRGALRACLLAQIQADREGLVTDQGLIKRAIAMLVDLGDSAADPLRLRHPTNIFGESLPTTACSVYAADFERAFLASSGLYFARKSTDMLATLDSASYLQRVDEILAHEDARAATGGVHRSTRAALMRTIHDTMLVAHHAHVLAGVVAPLALASAENAVEACLGRAYRLYAQVDGKVGLEVLRKAVVQKIRDIGCAAPVEATIAIGRQGMNGGAAGATEQGDDDEPPAGGTPIGTSAPSSIMSVGSAAGATAPASSSAAAATKPARGRTGTATAGDAPDQASSEALKWVSHVVGVQRLINHVQLRCFASDPLFERGLHDVETVVINHAPRAPEYLALFLDHHLKRSTKQSDADADAAVKNALSVFQFLQQRDEFDRFYSQCLSRRLLRKSSASDEAEQSVIAQLRSMAGAQFTVRMEKMLTDMAMSAEIAADFEVHRRVIVATTDNPLIATGPGLIVNVLTSASWPVGGTASASASALAAAPEGSRAAAELAAGPAAAVVYPDAVRAMMTVFEEYYAKRFSRRVLTWMPSLGTADVTAYYKAKRELSVTTYTMVVLMLFNRHDTWTYEDMLTETGIPAPELKRTLQSVSVGKVALLTKSPMTSKAVNAGDTFTFNASFTHKMTRIKIAAIVGTTRAEGDADRASVHADVDQERRHLVDAAIVRVMKARRRLVHNELVAEVTRIVTPRFICQPTLIKKQIETLIDREFLERSPSDTREYHYVA